MKFGVFVSAFAILSLVSTFNVSGQEKGRPQSKNLTGAVSKVDPTSLTVLQRGDSGDRTTLFAISPSTKILLQTNDDETAKAGEGRERKIPKTKEGASSDIKLNQRVTVSFTETGKADSILVLRPMAPRKNEGEQ